MKNSLIFLFLIAFVHLACGKSEINAPTATTLNSEIVSITAKQLLGSWELKSFVMEKTDGSKKNWGEDTTGLLIYTKEGTMSVSINSKSSGNDPDSQLKSILFYSGTYEVRNGNIVIHKVTQASDFERVGKDMIREASLQGNILTLVAKKENGLARLTWRRR